MAAAMKWKTTPKKNNKTWQKQANSNKPDTLKTRKQASIASNHHKNKEKQEKRHRVAFAIVSAAFPAPKIHPGQKQATTQQTPALKHTQQSATAADNNANNKKQTRQAAQAKTMALIRHGHGSGSFCLNFGNYGKNASRPVWFLCCIEYTKSYIN